MAEQLYKIKNIKTGEFATKGCGWSKHGKTWSSKNAFHLHLHRRIKYALQYRSMVQPQDMDVVMVEIEEKDAIPLEKYLIDNNVKIKI